MFIDGQFVILDICLRIFTLSKTAVGQVTSSFNSLLLMLLTSNSSVGILVGMALAFTLLDAPF